MQALLQLLGGPQLFAEGKAVAVSVNRSLVLASYLAYQAAWVSRNDILVLFWPDTPENKARQSLRALLYQCKNSPYAAQVEIEQGRLRWLGMSDVDSFQEAIASGHWQEALRLYQGTFLARVQADNSSAFEDWLEQTRNELHTAWRDAALLVAKAETEQANLSRAITLLETVLSYDFLEEAAVQACMRAYALAGQQAKALKTFEVFSQRLAKELELAPVEATLKLAEQIRTNVIMPSTAAVAVTPAKPTSIAGTASLPQFLTPFIGRTLELLELANLLKHTDTRLISLIGPGGTGKTRLSLQLLKEQQQLFSDGVCFVALAPLRSSSDIPNAVASALQLQLSGEESVETEVFGYLQNKSILMVLDNVEHLAGAASFISRLLAQSQRCIIIYTSRVVLGLANEVIYDVPGLSVPSFAKVINLEAYDAVQLFIRTARRARSDFSLSKADYPLLIQLCQFLEGMPLALELAASWLRLFSLPDLLGELSKDIDLLEAVGTEVSERHQSLARVFETSWQLLNSEQQQVLAALSIFRGGFDLAAARTIMGASARTLLSLVNSSLLRTTALGRFSIFEVIRQYAAKKHIPDAKLLARHARYYLDLLAQLTEDLNGDSPKASLGVIENDLENMRIAWYWALSEADDDYVDLCYHGAESLSIFFKEKARYQEALSLFSDSLKALAQYPNSKMQALCLLEQGLFYFDANSFELSQSCIEASLSLAKGLSDIGLGIRNLCALVNLNNARGDYERALAYGEEALALAEHYNLTAQIVRCRNVLSMTEEFRGNFIKAEEHYIYVLRHHRQGKKKLNLIKVLNNYGCFLNDTLRPREAQALFLEGLELVKSTGISAMEAFITEGLGKSAYLLADYIEAINCTEQALAIYSTHDDSDGQAASHMILADSYLALKNLDMASLHVKQAVHLCYTTASLRKLMTAVLAWAEILLAEKDLLAASTLLFVVKHHEASKKICKDAAESLAKRFKLELPEKVSDEALSDILNAFLLEKLMAELP